MKLTLVNKEQVAKGTVSFFWEADPPFTWRPGQFLYYTVPLPATDKRGNTRHFTIASSPTENVIQLTTRIRDESLFKETLNGLEVGTVIEGSGPRGDFVLDEEKNDSQVFLAGGIGITPFRSIIKFATDKNLKTPIHLIYSNSVPEEIAFKSDLDSWMEINSNLKVSYTITKPEDVKDWNGLTSRIDESMIENLLKIENKQSLSLRDWNLKISTITWWVCGPPAFVSGMQDELQKLGVSGDKVELEQFTGY